MAKKDIPLKDQSQRDKVINTQGHFFISAGAGTGKSTMIVRKIIDLIEKGHISNFKEFVAITYTNKAAEELRFKLQEHIHKKLNSPGLNPQVMERYSQINKGLHFTLIGTIHHFCTYWIRKYSLDLNLDSQFKILDDLNSKKILAEVFLDSIYRLEVATKDHNSSKEEKEIHHILQELLWHTKGNSEYIIDKLKSIHRNIHLIKDVSPDQFLITTKEKFTQVSKIIIQEHVKNFLRLQKMYKEPSTKEEVKFGDFLNELADSLNTKDILSGKKTWEDIIELCSHVSSTSKRGSANYIEADHNFGMEAEEIFRCIKLYTKMFLNKKINSVDIAKLGIEEKKYLESNYLKKHIILDPKILFNEYLRFLWYKVSLYTRDQFWKYKAQYNFLDYQDILLKMREIPDFNLILKKELKYLFVDEYQDTDELQANIFEILSSLGVNFIRVGDRNQAIYGFRGGNPRLYSTEEKKMPSEKLASLFVNMRSHPNILAFINWLFSGGDNGSIGKGQIDAHEDIFISKYFNHYQPLYPSPGSSMKFKNARTNIEAGVCFSFICKPEYSEGEPGKVKQSSYSSRKMEAIWLGEKIKAIMDENSEKKPKIGVLFRSFTTADIYIDQFQKKGISYSTLNKVYTKEAYPLFPLLHIFKLLIRPHDQIAFTGLLRSPLVGLSDPQIDEFIKNRYIKFIDLKNPNEIFNEIPFSSKVNHLLQKLHLCHNEIYSSTLEDIFHLVLNSFPVYEMIQIHKNSNELNLAIQNIFSIARYVENNTLFKKRFQVLTEFTELIEQYLVGDGNKNLFPNSLSKEHIPLESDVQIITIHQSKGLEYDIVFLCDLNYDLLKAEKNNIFYFQENVHNRSLDFYMKEDIADSLIDQSKTPSLLRQEEALEELLRLLYVALTRAKYKIYLPILSPNKSNYYSYKRWILQAMEQKFDPNFIHRIPDPPSVQKINIENDLFIYVESTIISLDENINLPEEDILLNSGQKSKSQAEILSNHMNKEWESFRFISPTSIASISDPLDKPSDQENMYYKEENIWERNLFLMGVETDQKKLTAKEKGVLMHRVLEWTDLKFPSWTEEMNQSLLRIHLIPSSWKDFIFHLADGLLNDYKNSILYQLIQKGILLGKETHFSMLMEPKKIATGYVDLIFRIPVETKIKQKIYAKGIYFIDYKSNKQPSKDSWEIFSEVLIEKYEKQISLYKKALHQFLIAQNKGSEEIFGGIYHIPSGNLILM